MFQHILVPLDGSALAEQALPTAARLARSVGGSVILLRVVKPPVEYAGGDPYRGPGGVFHADRPIQ